MDGLAQHADRIIAYLARLRPEDELVAAASVFLNVLQKHLDYTQEDATNRARLAAYTQKVYTAAAALEAAETSRDRDAVAAFHATNDNATPHA